MPIYSVDVTRHVEATVTVEAATAQQARVRAESPQYWLDQVDGNQVHVEAHHASRVDDGCTDDMSAWKTRCEA